MGTILFGKTQSSLDTPFEPARNPDYNGLAGTLTATTAQEAIEEVFNNAPGKQARFTISLLNNSSMTNNQRFGYSELLPNSPVILPRKCRLKEITFTNQNTNTDAQFEIYRRSPPLSTPTPGVTATLLYTWNITNSLTSILTNLDLLFNAGNEILIRFVDTGDNPADATMVLFFVNDDTP